jgi:LysM repeat protein
VDQLRLWLSRVLAPLAFLAAVAALVVVVQRALDDREENAAVTQATEPVESSPVTTDTGGEETPAGRRFYRIQPGDTLEGIAAEFDTTVDSLLELNPNLDPLALDPGTRIRVA